MEKYVPIQTHSHDGSCRRRSYNLPVSYLPHFRETFGNTLFKITDEEFIKWCKDNNVTLYKTIMTTVKVKIDEY